MLGTFTLVLAATVVDPRPELVELQLAGKPRQALTRVEQEIEERPEAARRFGLSYLRAHLLEAAGRLSEAADAFTSTMGDTPALALYSRYRMAVEQDRMGHPEMATGLVATVAAGDPRSPLTPMAVRLLAHTLSKGGDCRLLNGLRAEALPAPQRREVLLAHSDCAQRAGNRELARGLLVRLIEENRGDEPARAAAERLAGMVSEAEKGRLPMLLGFTFHEHLDFSNALRHLHRAMGRGDVLSARDAYRTLLTIGLSMMSEQRYTEAAARFSRATALARSPGERARALYQEGLVHEMRRVWPFAAAKFRHAYEAEPLGRWAAPSLLSALRANWRLGSEASGLAYYQRLTERPEWRAEAARAALFLAASEVSRGRRARVRSWLEQASAGGRDDRLEVSYWSGRLAELERDNKRAVARYLDLLHADLYHPLAQAARARLAAEPLARTTAAEGRSRASTGRTDDLYDAWLLLGNDDPAGRTARLRLEAKLRSDPNASPYLRLAEIPVRRWRLWKQPLTDPEEMLLALGLWREGAPAVREHFPLHDPSLAFTGGQLLVRGGEVSRSIALADALRSRTPSRVPLALQPAAFRLLLYPAPFREISLAEGRARGVDPDLLTALLREESRFDAYSLSPDSSRGLARLTPAAARRIAAQVGLERVSPQSLCQPRVSIALGAAHLAALLKDFGGATMPAIAAYDAGEGQAIVWRSHCFTQEPDEYFTKIASRETRDYVRRVLAGRVQYEELY